MLIYVQKTQEQQDCMSITAAFCVERKCTIKVFQFLFEKRSLYGSGHSYAGTTFEPEKLSTVQKEGRVFGAHH